MLLSSPGIECLQCVYVYVYEYIYVYMYMCMYMLRPLRLEHKSY